MDATTTEIPALSLPAPSPFDDDRYGLVDCGLCGKELTGERTAKAVRAAPGVKKMLKPEVAGRVIGRPYCGACLVIAMGRSELHLLAALYPGR